jgi:hypothetical protein
MSIVGLEGLSTGEINEELRRGARFVVFEYCISIIVLTFKRSSAIHFVRSDEGTFGKGLGYTLLSLTLGWWGFPWGIIYTISTVATNCAGGRDVTSEVRVAVRRSLA